MRAVVLKNSAFPQFCFHFEICQFESFLRSRKALYDPPSPRTTALLVTPLERRKKSFMFSYSILKEAGLIPDAPAYFCLLPYFKAIFSLPKYARKSSTSPAALGEGQPRSSYYLWMGRGRETETLLMPRIFLDPTAVLPRKSEI